MPRVLGMWSSGSSEVPPSPLLFQLSYIFRFSIIDLCESPIFTWIDMPGKN